MEKSTIKHIWEQYSAEQFAKADQILLVEWAALCAEHVLGVFEKENEDDRPRTAIDAARAWVRGEMKVQEARKCAFAAHSAARCASGKNAVSAARSAGHAAATVHVRTHAIHAAIYALKASKNPLAELEWQKRELPERLKSILL